MNYNNEKKMAITTNFKQIQERFNSKYWKSIDEFEEYYLQEISERLEDTNYYTDRNGNEVKIPPINHHPKLKKYEIWIEGYISIGEGGTVQLIGKTKARNFAQACHIIMCEKYLEQIEKNNQSDYNGYVTPGRWDYNPDKLTYWGCRLYWNEELATKIYG